MKSALLLWGWIRSPLKVPSNPNYSTILCLSEIIVWPPQCLPLPTPSISLRAARMWAATYGITPKQPCKTLGWQVLAPAIPTTPESKTSQAQSWDQLLRVFSHGLAIASLQFSGVSRINLSFCFFKRRRELRIACTCTPLLVLSEKGRIEESLRNYKQFL